MKNGVLGYLIRFVGLVLLQVLVLNNINFLGVLNPYLYIYLILMMPSSVKKDALLVWGFLLGLSVDVFCGTLGCHTFATTLLAYLKPHFQKLFGPREDYEVAQPSLRSFGVEAFLKYVVTLALLHHLAFFYIEALSLAHFWRLLWISAGCTIFTVLLIFLIQKIFRK